LSHVHQDLLQMDKEAVFQLAHTIHQQLLSAQQDSNQMDMEIV